MKYNVYALGIMVAVVSFLGFVVENIWLAMTKGYMNNRNMNAPFLLGYGLLILFMFFILGTPNDMILPSKIKKKLSKRAEILLYFVCAFVLVCVSEIALGTIVEKICHIEYWNYSNLPMHITKYTSVPTSLAFASLITVFMGVIFTPLMNNIMRVDIKYLKIISTVLVVIMTADFISSFYKMIKKKSFLLLWQIPVEKVQLKLFN